MYIYICIFTIYNNTRNKNTSCKYPAPHLFPKATEYTTTEDPIDAISLLKWGLPKQTGNISAQSSPPKLVVEYLEDCSEWIVLKAAATPSDSSDWHFTQIKSSLPPSAHAQGN